MNINKRIIFQLFLHLLNQAASQNYSVRLNVHFRRNSINESMIFENYEAPHFSKLSVNVKDLFTSQIFIRYLCLNDNNMNANRNNYIISNINQPAIIAGFVNNASIKFCLSLDLLLYQSIINHLPCMQYLPAKLASMIQFYLTIFL